MNPISTVLDEVISWAGITVQPHRKAPRSLLLGARFALIAIGGLAGAAGIINPRRSVKAAGLDGDPVSGVQTPAADST